jgi:hypothetical protein
MARKQVHAVPDGEGGWNVKSAGSKKAVANYEDKTDAVSKAKEIAKNAPLRQVVVHDKHGVIQTESTYRKDPDKYKE